MAAKCSARSSVGQWRHALGGGGLGEADAVAGGEDDVGVVQQPVDCGVGDGFGHEFVEPGRVKVALTGPHMPVWPTVALRFAYSGSERRAANDSTSSPTADNRLEGGSRHVVGVAVH